MTSPSHRPNERLRQARLLRGWSQQDVADRIGASNYYLSRWERGTTSPSPYYRQKLCALFEKDAAELGLLADPEEAEPESQVPPGADAVSSLTGLASEQIYDPLLPLLATGNTRLVGRDALLAGLRQRLCSETLPAFIAIHGLPGVGKTALSVALAHDPAIREHFSDGLLWAGLGPRPEIASLLSHWGTLLGVTPAAATISTPDVETWALTLKRAIGKRRMLIFIDDAWNLDDLLTFRVGGPACAYVVTTRFPQIAAQFATDEVLALEELDEDESMALLQQMIHYLAQDEPEALKGLVRAVGGLPLALTLMGRYLLAQTHNRQPRRARAALERLRDAETRLTLSVPQALLGRSPALPAQSPVSLQTVITVSHQRLDAEARQALQALAVFPPKPNTFSESAALAVAATNEETLDALSDAGLLECRAGRYTLHQTICDYALSTLNDVEPYQRLIAYFVAYVEDHQKDYEALDREMMNILAALDAAFTHHQPSELMRGLKHCYAFLDARGLYELAEHYLQQAREGWEELNAETRGQILYLSGKVAEQRSDMERAQNCYEEGLQYTRASGVAREIGILLAAQGAFNVRSGRYELAEEKLQEALEIARQTQDSDILIRVLGSRGAIANERGNFAEGEAYLLEALDLIHQTGKQDALFQVLNNLCSSTAEQGKYEQAEGYQLEFVELARRLGHREKLCGSLCNLGALYSCQKKYDQAKDALAEALSLARQLQHNEWYATILANQAEVAEAEGRAQEAVDLLRQALELARQADLGWLVASILLQLGQTYLNLGELAAADPPFAEAQAWASSQRSQLLLAESLYGRARLAALRHDYAQAARDAHEALALYEACGHRKVAEVRCWLESLPALQRPGEARR